MEDVAPSASAVSSGPAFKSCGLVALMALTFLGVQGAPASHLRPTPPHALRAMPEDFVSLLAVRIQNRSKTFALSKSAISTARAEPILVKLSRKTGRTSPETTMASESEIGPDWHDSPYVGRVYVGSPRPQVLEVAFDTASGQIILPSSRCRSLACQEHRRFAPIASTSARDINGNGAEVQVVPGAKTVKRDAITIGVSSMDHGSGKAVGDLVEDQVCLGRASGDGRCIDIGFVAVTEMSDVPFRAMVQDGIVGLGMGALTTSPIFHLLTRLSNSSQLASQSFGLFLGEHSGELALGGANDARVLQSSPHSSPSLAWASVLRPEEGYWQLSVRAVHIGNSTIACHQGSEVFPSGCRGIVDSSAAGLGVPEKLAKQLLPLVTSTASAEPGSRCAGPDLQLEVEGAAGSVILRLSSEDYHSKSCQPMLMPTQLPEDFANVFILGQPLLRKYYTVFDWGSRKIGFGPAAPEEVLPSSALLEEEDQDAAVNVLTTAEAEALEEQAIAAARAQQAHHGTAIEARTVAIFLMQGVFMQAMIVLLLVLTNSRQVEESLHLRILLARICRGLGVKLPGSGKLTSLLLAMTPMKEEEMPEASECVVCLGVREEEVSDGSRPRWCRLRCGHNFHEDCIFEWLQKAQRCPICRSHVIDTEEKTKKSHEETPTAPRTDAEDPSSPTSRA